jgi:RNA 2',3'-cyclic 3'-phosphodiesterase
LIIACARAGYRYSEIDIPMNIQTTETLRLFFALWPDDTTRTALMQLQSSMQGRTIPYNNLHLTLAFLGQQPAAVLADASQILAHLPSLPVSLCLDRVGYFARNRIAWVGMHQVPQALLTLQQELKNALRQHEISSRDEHAFKPHITLARDATLPPDIIFTPIKWRANQVALVQSITQAEGVNYHVLASRSLDEACRVPDEDG